MRVFHKVIEFREWRHGVDAASIAEGRGLPTVGFVPTMGALHAGHQSLLERARSENQYSVLSLFVNPTQFNQASDFEKYPKTIEADLALAERIGIDVVILPEDAKELYPEGYRYKVTENEFSTALCGAHRPGHFDGVLTVVMKLFMLARPTRAYFGEKDYQQLSLIRDMARAFFLDTEVVGCPTVRESDGLALSSRNVRLNSGEREIAPEIHHAITAIGAASEAKKALEAKGFKVDYLEDRAMTDGTRRRFVAAFLGDVRLIDNVPLPSHFDREAQ